MNMKTKLIENIRKEIELTKLQGSDLVTLSVLETIQQWLENDIKELQTTIVKRIDNIL